MQINKGNKLYSIIHLKCPKCQEGNLFSVSNAYNFRKMLDMPSCCPVCKQDFEIEPGFYSGALWTSYPIVVAIILLLALLLIFYLEISLLWFFLTITVVLTILQPLIMRYSRAVWINLFVSYEPSRMK